MRTGIAIIFLAVFLLSCGSKGGTIEHRVKFTTGSNALKSSADQIDSIYTDFGSYVTSITPKYFSAKINILMYLDNWDQRNDSTHMISYIDGHDNQPGYDISITVDFSGNQEISYAPILYGTDIWNGIFMQKEVTFKYFYFVCYHFTQDFEVPEPYGDINIIGNNGTYSVDSVTGRRMITINNQPLIEPVFGYTNQQPFGYFFGNTDSTFIFNRERADVPPSENHPNGGSSSMIRSNHYTPVTVVMPEAGETIEMFSTISFNTDNLIQVYAGGDNIPYTVDDVFVYAPKYWERLAVRLEIN